MAANNQTLRQLFDMAEKKHGFRFACELHQALLSGSDVEAMLMLEQALA